MKVLVVGAGAIGMLFGSYIKLVDPRSTVTYVTRSRLQAEKIRQEGIEFHSKEGAVSFLQCNAIPFEAEEKLENKDEKDEAGGRQLNLCGYEMVLVTVKQTQLDNVLTWLRRRVSQETPLLFLMNGLGHAEKVKTALPKHHRVYFGITQSGATKKDLNVVVEKGRNITKVGQIKESFLSSPAVIDKESIDTKESKSSLHNWITLLAQQGIPLSWAEDIETEMWKKCVINACINPLTALFRVQNGKLVENAQLHQLMRNLYDELVSLVYKSRSEDAEKILVSGRTWQEIEEVCRITSENLSSMEQDIRYGRLTEIESINGFFILEAKKHHLSMPSHCFVYHSILYLQDRL